MLILTRKINETIIIGDDIKVKVLDIKGKQVRLGIDAPISLAVHREEVFQRIQEQNIQSLTLDIDDLEKITAIWGQGQQK